MLSPSLALLPSGAHHEAHPSAIRTGAGDVVPLRHQAPAAERAGVREAARHARRERSRVYLELSRAEKSVFRHTIPSSLPSQSDDISKVAKEHSGTL